MRLKERAGLRLLRRYASAQESTTESRAESLKLSKIYFAESRKISTFVG